MYLHPSELRNCIYELTDPRTGKVRYVGQTINGYKRIRQHKWDAHSKDDYHHMRWLRSIERVGVEYGHRIIQELPDDATPDDIDDAEIFWIAQRRFEGCRLTNATDGGRGPRGMRHSDGTRAVMAVKHKARWQDPVIGPKLRAKRAERRGIKLPEHVVNKIAEANRGKKRTPEQCRGMSASRKGKPGRVQSPEEIAKRKGLNKGNTYGKANKGRKFTGEALANIQDAQHRRQERERAEKAAGNGKKRSPEAVANLTEGQQRRTRVMKFVASMFGWDSWPRAKRGPYKKKSA